MVSILRTGWFSDKCEIPIPDNSMTGLFRPEVCQRLVEGRGCPYLSRDPKRRPCDGSRKGSYEYPSRDGFPTYMDRGPDRDRLRESGFGRTPEREARGWEPSREADESGRQATPTGSATYSSMGVMGPYQLTHKDLDLYARVWAAQRMIPPGGYWSGRCRGYNEGVATPCNCSGWDDSRILNPPLSGSVGANQGGMDAVGRFMAALDACRQRGSAWRQCASVLRLEDLAAGAVSAGMSQQLVDRLVACLEDPNPTDCLQVQMAFGVAMSCLAYSDGQLEPQTCGGLASTIQAAVWPLTSRLLTTTEASLVSTVNRYGESDTLLVSRFDPRRVVDDAYPVAQGLYEDAVAALHAAWRVSREALGLAPMKVDLEPLLRAYLYDNGWSRNVGHLWAYDECGTPPTVRLRGMRSPEDRHVPRAESGPWATSFHAWPVEAGPSERRLARNAVVGLYYRWRIEPLQRAVLQAVREIAAINSYEAVAGGTSGAVGLVDETKGQSGDNTPLLFLTVGALAAAGYLLWRSYRKG